MLPSFYNHDCDPNAHIIWIENADAKLKALRDIEEGEELRICYIDASMGHNARQTLLFQGFGFQCSCLRCLSGMGALFLNSFSIAPNKFARVSYKCDRHLLWMRKSSVHCQLGGNAGRSSGISSVLKEMSTSLSSEHSSATLMDAGSLVLSPNGKSQAEIAVKDLVPYGGPTTSIVELQDGIGIVKYLRGKVFFITGATGFLAKVFIEKILRTVPDVGKIFVLIKAKNREAAMERLKSEIINAELFKCLRQTYGKSYQAFMLRKLVPVVGNVCESNLGIEEDLANVMAKEVDIIVNSAANTTFDERYDVAIDINTRGPCHLMGFAKQCTKLKLFLQVSTAYVNGQRQGKIMEKPFCIGDNIAREFVRDITPRFLPILDIQNEIELATNSKENFEENSVAQKMKELGLQRARKYGWQDTYVFTKAMGEMMIDNMRGDIPVVVIRPSVIESTCNEPFPGWMEGNRMMDPIVLYYGKGQLSGFLVDPNGVLDVVPADMVVNATLAAIARHGMAKKPGINVYQIASSVVNPLVFEDLARLLYEHYNSFPCVDSKGRPIHVPSMKLFSSMEDFSAHLWRDAIQRSGLTAMSTSNAKLSQKLEVICRKSVEQAKYLANIYEPYTFYGGRFDNSNTQRLMDSMSEGEKMKFGFDVGSIDWKDYITNVHIPGLRRHVMKGRGMCG
ncbi:SET domain-containing protein/Sterile domain-containing protein/NAD_binding_4 domain-containing protein [Cephalotus follicularis]|uniref:Fatty acyl-CoA reductase n=1 Tax=Cephalotus follicularis TaxID=3775 RepID=A0A1Q3D0X3_CEPFO|nr:SET domain-containing protein/Sterile domain-containing protein/NAD_binding_4 domain-containing protein [Cephalotus follicularis]